MEKQVMVDGVVVYELKNFSELTSEFRHDVRAELDKGMFVAIRFADDLLTAMTPTFGIVNNVLAMSHPRLFNTLSRIDNGLWRAMHYGKGYSELSGGQ